MPFISPIHLALSDCPSNGPKNGPQSGPQKSVDFSGPVLEAFGPETHWESWNCGSYNDEGNPRCHGLGKAAALMKAIFKMGVSSMENKGV